MSGSFGAGFFTLGLLAVLGGLAGLLGLVAVAAYAQHQRVGQVPPIARFLAVAGLVGAVASAGFGVLALFDESLVGAGLIGVLALVPLATAIGRGWHAGRGWLDLLAGAALAWSLPYLLGLATFLAIHVGVIEAFQLAGGESRALGLVWIAGAAGGLVALVGTVRLQQRAAAWFPPPDP